MPYCIYKGLKSINGEYLKCEFQICQPVFLTPPVSRIQTNSHLLVHNTFKSESDSSFTFLNVLPLTSRPAQQRPDKTRKSLPLKSVMLNCQSVKTDGKPDQLKKIVSSLHADVIIGNDLWLNSSIKSAEVFTDVFNSYRRDRRDGSGDGVFILQPQKYESHQPEV